MKGVAGGGCMKGVTGGGGVGRTSLVGWGGVGRRKGLAGGGGVGRTSLVEGSRGGSQYCSRVLSGGVYNQLRYKLILPFNCLTKLTISTEKPNRPIWQITHRLVL